MFYAYENWTNTFVKVHRAECSFCNSGTGVHAAGPRTRSGEWHGPYPSARDALKDAERLAHGYDNASIWTIDTCSFCIPT